MEPRDFVWLFAMGMVLAFTDGYGIGANDVANSFSTSVGSGTLSYLQACGIAVFTEFFGAFLLGSHTAETIKGKLIKSDLYAARPELLMLTMVCALLGSSVWTITATRFGWPVSTTHSIVGSITGAGIAVFGGGAVNWGYSGLGKIIASWFISPVISGVVAAFVFLTAKFIVLEHENSFERGLKIIPVYFGFTAIINIFFIVYKGSPRLNTSAMSTGAVVGITLGVGVAVVAFTYLFYIPFLRRRIIENEDIKWWELFMVPFIKKRPARPEPKLDEIEQGDHEPVEAVSEETSFLGRVKRIIMHPVTVDVTSIEGDKRLEAMHDNSKKYDPDTETLYSFLQVVTAALASFAHGSNDVANATGPLSVIYDIYRTGKVPKNAPVELWILAYGGLAIDVGLLTYGWRIFKSLGNHLTYHSPSRGFSMELGTVLTVLTASKLGIPVSTTQCITGATIGVGLCSGKLSSVNWRKVIVIFFSWVATVPIAGTIAGLVMLFASRAPNV